jgi:hypothetical protein
MGCVARLGCFIVLVLIAAAGWFTRGLWLDRIRSGGRDSVATATQTWQQLTPEGARRAETALRRLQTRNGPVFATVAPGDLAAYIFQQLSSALPTDSDSIEAAAIGDRLIVRAVIPTKPFRDQGALGPLGGLLGDRELVQMGGVLRIIRPGMAEFQVKEFKVRDFGIPQALIPRLIRQMSRGERPPDLSPDGLALRTPEYIADVRVANGAITMYKTLPAR